MQITMHRALSMLKTTEKRIIKELADARFIQITVGQTGTCNGNKVSDVENEIRASYDSVNSLIENYQALKLGIIRANSGMKDNAEDFDAYDIDGKKYIVAEIIAIQKFVIPMMERFLDTLTHQADAVNSKIEMLNGRVSSEVSGVISAMSNGDKTKLSSEQIEAFTKTYYDNHCSFAVDPLKLSEKISALRDKIDKISVEADSKLSEVNALKVIDVDIQ